MPPTAPSIGLKSLYYAILSITDDGLTVPTYNAPVKIAEAMSAKIQAKMATDIQWADDGPVEIIQSTGEVTAEFAVKDFPLSVQASVLGHTISAGTLVRKTTDTAPYVAIGFKSRKSNGKYRYVWLYKGKFEVIEQDYATLAEKVKAQNPVLKGTFVKRLYDDAWQKIADEDETGYVASIGTNWFSYVDNSADVVAPTVSSVNPANGATAVATSINPALTFSEAIQNYLPANIFLVKSTDGSVVAATNTINGVGTIVTIAPTAALTAATKYFVLVTTDVKDINNNAIAVAYVSNFTCA